MPRLVDTTVRLLSQEPFTGHLPTAEILQVAEILDKAGFACLEISGGGVFDATVRRNAYGSQVDSFEADIELSGEPLHAVFIRAPVIEETGPDVEVLAECRDRPVVVREGDILAATFHPELIGETRLHRLLVEAMR